MGKSKLFFSLSKLHKEKWSIAFKGMFIGLLSGLFVILYRFIIEIGTEKSIEIYKFLRTNNIYIIPWLIFIVAVAFLFSKLVSYETMACGSGIPQVEGILLLGMKIKYHSVLIVRFILGTVAAFFGLSLGREGPSIQIGASVAQGASEKIKSNRLEENYLVTSGAAAGLSAAFNAPLSGIVFTLEEIHKSFSPLLIITVATATLSSDLLSKFFFGLNPVLSFAKTPAIPYRYYFLVIPIGILSGLLGSFINKALLHSQTLYKKVKTPIRFIIALTIALLCGLFLPEILGGGMNLIELSETAKTGIGFMFILMLFKLVFTLTSFGSGAPGGIFMPILSIGALLGAIIALSFIKLGMPGYLTATIAVCAMAGTLSSSVKAPVTSILLVAEMTGSLQHLFPVAAVCFLSLYISDMLKIHPVYEALLERLVSSSEDKFLKSENIIEIPVEFGSKAMNRMVKDVVWPEESLLIGIQRGQRKMIPKGNTVIKNGDFLIIATADNEIRELNQKIREVCSRNSLNE